MSCEHPGCHCTDATLEQDGKQFCSEHCAEAAQSKPRGTGCDCGHPDCAAV
ncbi:MAG: metallothionein [Thermoanaerobaculia bacterium]